MYYNWTDFYIQGHLLGVKGEANNTRSLWVTHWKESYLIVTPVKGKSFNLIRLSLQKFSKWELVLGEAENLNAETDRVDDALRFECWK